MKLENVHSVVSRSFRSRGSLVMLLAIGVALACSFEGCGLSREEKARRAKAILATHKDAMTECDRLQSEVKAAVESSMAGVASGDLYSGYAQQKKGEEALNRYREKCPELKTKIERELKEAGLSQDEINKVWAENTAAPTNTK